jgi:hypothetical protein
MAKFIAIYGTLMIVSAIAAVIIAGIKRRDYSYWGAVTFLFPPFLLLLILMPRNQGPRPRRPTLDEEDDNFERLGH